MSQHDQVLAQIKSLLGIQTTDRTVSGYTGHYLPSGKYFYVGTPKADGPVRITTNVEIPGKQAKWMPRGSVRSAFMSTDADAIVLMVQGLLDGAVQPPARKAPQPKAVISPAPAPTSHTYSDAELADLSKDFA
jgi:hypothetical protein